MRAKSGSAVEQQRGNARVRYGNRARVVKIDVDGTSAQALRACAKREQHEQHIQRLESARRKRGVEVRVTQNETSACYHVQPSRLFCE